jgi:hypothetical protein
MYLHIKYRQQRDKVVVESREQGDQAGLTIWLASVTDVDFKSADINSEMDQVTVTAASCNRWRPEL